MKNLEIKIGELKREIKMLIVHCSATREYKPYNFKEIEAMHKRIFKSIGGCCCGYHFIVLLDGTIVQTKAIQYLGQHAKGFNNNSIGICYIGGLSTENKPKDTRTMAQKESMQKLLIKLKEILPKVIIKGHRDLSPDKNKNGKIEKNEWIKECPCFDVQKEYSTIK